MTDFHHHHHHLHLPAAGNELEDATAKGRILIAPPRDERQLIVEIEGAVRAVMRHNTGIIYGCPLTDQGLAPNCKLLIRFPDLAVLCRASWIYAGGLVA